MNLCLSQSGSWRVSHYFLLLLIIGLMTGFASGQDGTVKWTFDLGSNTSSSPAIGDEGIIYIGAANNNLFAIQPDGTEQWRFDTGANIDEPPVIADDGTIYVGNQDGIVFAVNPDGTQRWTFDPGIGTALSGEMALAADGTLYAGIGTAVDARVFAINPDGSQFWVFDPDTTTQGISIGPDGIVVFAADADVYALNPDGSLKWQTVTGAIAHLSPPIFGEDGTIYAASRSFTALNPDDGSILWQVDVGDSFESASTAENGDIYVPIATSATEGAVVALDPADGSEIWRFAVGARVQTAPAVGFDGTIYFGTDTEEFYALSPNGTQLWVVQAGGDIRPSATIAEDGTVYFASNDRNLYAVRSSSTGLAASSWPKKQRDVRNTGQFGSDVTRRRFFAPHVFSVGDANSTVITIAHIGGSAGNPLGTTANFRIDVLNRDGSVNFSMEDSVGPGETKDIVLEAPGGGDFVGAAVIDAPVKDGSFLAPFLTWVIDVSEVLEPLRIGVFFSDPTDAALVHHFPAESNATIGLGIAVQNIGDNEIDCTLEFFNADGTKEAEVALNLNPLGSNVGFFDDSVPVGFKGKASFLCDAPVVAIAVNQDFANGGFPTDRLTIKGRN